MTATIVSRALRAGSRLMLAAFAVGLLLGLSATVASAAPPPAELSDSAVTEHLSSPAPIKPGDLSICPGVKCDTPDPGPVYDGPHDLTICPKPGGCEPPKPTKPGDLTTCPADVDCTDDPKGPGDIVVCTEDCGPSDDPSDTPGETPSDEPDGGSGDDSTGDPSTDDGTTVDGIPVPTRIDTGLGGASGNLRLVSVLLALLIGVSATIAGVVVGARR